VGLDFFCPCLWEEHQVLFWNYSNFHLPKNLFLLLFSVLIIIPNTMNQHFPKRLLIIGFFISLMQLTSFNLFSNPLQSDVLNMVHREMDWRTLLAQDRVAQDQLNRYVKLGKRQSTALLKRALFYFPIFERHLNSRDLPMALKYLPMVESELRENVVSPYRAAGLWQFIPVTARHYGLRVGKPLDQRFDPELSSGAAAVYLSELYAEFGDWFLVLAAYNCGSGRVRKALRHSRIDTYEGIRLQLPRQTRRYISKFIAAACLANHYQDYGIVLPLPAQVKPIESQAEPQYDSICNPGIHIVEVIAASRDFLQHVDPQQTLPAANYDAVVMPYLRWFEREKPISNKA
jgi:Transglycosylase SLT domain